MGGKSGNKKARNAISRKKRRSEVTAIRGLHEVRVINSNGETKLELRHKLKMAREPFSRLVNVSPRTIADVEL